MESESLQQQQDGYSPPSFRLPVEAGKRGVIVIGKDHRVAFTDPNIFGLLGIEAGAIAGQDRETAVREVLKHRFKSPDDYEASCIRLREHPEEVLDDVLELAGEEHRVIHRYSAPLYDAVGHCSGRIEIYSDITRRRELEAAARKAFEDLKAAQEQLVESEKLRAVGEIAAGVAHDFNNIMGIILGNIELLLRSTEEPGELARLQSAEQAALDGVDTVRRIQEFTRSAPEQPPAVLDLSVVASEVVEMMRPVWQNQSSGQGIELTVDCETEAPVLASGHELREVITNILLNAVQAMPEGGRIEVSTSSTPDHCRVRISDTGTGMTEDVRRRIFDPFFTTRGVEGTGLGMSVAYGIVRRHGGSIGVDSEPGRGTTITVKLPRAEAQAETTQQMPPSVTADVEPARILVVDDEEMFVSVFVEMLSECGHAAVIARSGREAIDSFRQTPFDIVFTDLGMPEMSGWQVAKEIKSIEPKTPVVLLTGWGAALDDSELQNSEVDMVLAKPVRLEKLSSIVEEALSRRQ